MNKETSGRVSSIAAAILSFEPVTGPNADEYNDLLKNAKILAGSCMSLYLKTLDLRIQDLALQPRPINDKAPVASEQPIGEPREVGGHDEDRSGPIPFGD